MKAKISATSVRTWLETEHAELFDTVIANFHLRRRAKKGPVYRYRYTAKDGKRSVVTIGDHGALKPEEARRIASRLAVRVAAGEDPAAQDRQEKELAQKDRVSTLGNFLDGPWQRHIANRRSGAEFYSKLKRHCGSLMKKRMSDLDKADIINLQKSMENKGLSHSTVKRIYAELKSVLSLAVAENVLTQHPLKGVKLIAPVITMEQIADKESPDDKRRPLSKDEISALFHGIEQYENENRRMRRNSRAHGRGYLVNLDDYEITDFVKPWIFVAFYTGLRPVDIQTLRWNHIKFDAGVIDRYITKTSTSENPVRVIIPMASRLESVLKSWYQQRNNPLEKLVFPSHRVPNKPIDRKTFRDQWLKIKKYAGLNESLEPYSLRHSFATQMIVRGADLLTVSKLLGHKDINTTVDNYGHYLPDRASELMAGFELFVSESVDAAAKIESVRKGGK